MVPHSLRLGAFCMGAVLCLGVVEPPAAPAREHHGPQWAAGSPQPPRPPRLGREVVRVGPKRWSWIHWWEANRDRFLHPQLDADPGDRALNRLDARPRAVELLEELVRSSGHPVERAMAVQALGRMGGVSALPVIRHAAANDASEPVRMNALLALGLLGGRESAQTLVGLSYPTAGLLDAGLVALGLLDGLDELDSEVRFRLQGMARRGDGAGPLVLWALRQHPGEMDTALLQSLALRGSDLNVVSEALLGLGATGDDASAALVADVALGSVGFLRVGHRLQQEARLAQRRVGRDAWDAIRFPNRYRQFQRDLAVFRQRYPDAGAPAEPDGLRVFLRHGAYIGREELQYARLRASAVLGLTHVTHPQVAEMLLAVAGHERGGAHALYDRLVQSFAIMALGERREEAALPFLLRVLEDFDPRVRVDEETTSPVRGHAALALGLYARPDPREGPLLEPAGTEAALSALAYRLQDPREWSEVRGAAAVALGVSGRPAVLPALREVEPGRSDPEQMVYGYALLARGMLGDPTLPPEAGRLLSPRPREQASTERILARRAAALGLGLLGDEASVSILADAIFLDTYVSHEAARALALAERPETVQWVMQGIRGSDDPYRRAFMASLLGQLLQAERPARTHRIIASGNYTLRNARFRPFQGLANEFLFDHLAVDLVRTSPTPGGIRFQHPSLPRGR